MKVLVKSVIAFLMALLCCYTVEAQNTQPVKSVIIDAGHGIMPNGGYNGAKGTFSYEDEICLAIAKKLVAQLKITHPEIKVVETRPTKYIVGLKERANIANKANGDLFISIHVNALSPIQHKELAGYKEVVTYTGKGKKKKKQVSKVPQYRYYTTPNTNGKGTQTYIWGAQKSEDKETAVRENAVLFDEENYQEKYGDIDVNSPEFIAMSLVKTKQYGQRSAGLASMMEKEFAGIGRVSGGSRQRQVGIWVLQATAMPSILIETGFITNPEEEKYLNSEDGQEQMAQSINKGLDNYIDWIKKRALKTTTESDSTNKQPKNINAF